MNGSVDNLVKHHFIDIDGYRNCESSTEIAIDRLTARQFIDRLIDETDHNVNKFVVTLKDEPWRKFEVALLPYKRNGDELL